jgi:uncharacterized membrane-anchored protein
LPAVALVVQFRASGYRAGVYWLAVALMSVVGTLVSDDLSDNLRTAAADPQCTIR